MTGGASRFGTGVGAGPSLRLRLLNFVLRHTTKRRLMRARSAAELRAGLRRAAEMLPPPPPAIRFCADDADAPKPPLRRAGPGASSAAPSRRGASAASDAPPPRLLWCVAPESDPARVVLYLHGGAYLAGAPETHRSILAPLAAASRSLVAAPAYRLAPEHPFPAALEDAVAAYETLLARGWPGAAIAFAGESAGGGLAAALLAESAARGLPRPAALVVFSPFADLSLSGASLRRFARRDAMLPAARFAEAAEAYLAGADPRDPRASPVFARFDRPPPALIQAGDREALRDDAVRLAEALRAGGGDVRLELWPGAPHAFQFFAAILGEARAAIAGAGAFLDAAFEAEDGGSGVPPFDAAARLG